MALLRVLRTAAGELFEDGATVSFDGVPATDVKVVSSTRITAVTPPGTSSGAASTSNSGAGSPARAAVTAAVTAKPAYIGLVGSAKRGRTTRSFRV